MWVAGHAPSTLSRPHGNRFDQGLSWILFDVVCYQSPTCSLRKQTEGGQKDNRLAPNPATVLQTLRVYWPFGRMWLLSAAVPVVWLVAISM